MANSFSSVLVGAHLASPSTTVITLADTYQYLVGTFANNPLEGFALVSDAFGPALECRVDIPAWYEIDYHITAESDRNSTKMHGGISLSIGGGAYAIEDQSIDGTFLKVFNEPLHFSGSALVLLGYGDRVQLSITTDGTGDSVITRHYNTTIIKARRR